MVFALGEDAGCSVIEAAHIDQISIRRRRRMRNEYQSHLDHASALSLYSGPGYCFVSLSPRVALMLTWGSYDFVQMSAYTILHALHDPAV